MAATPASLALAENGGANQEPVDHTSIVRGVLTGQGQDSDYKDELVRTSGGMPGTMAGDLDYEGANADVWDKNVVIRMLFWIRSWALPGLGMFCEAYFVFSIGNVSSIFSSEYPECYAKHQEGCSVDLIRTETYVQIVAIMIGMLTLGYIADQIGRRIGSITTASIMFIGGILLTASGGTTIKGWVIMYTISQAIFGYGVGGEYPIASSSAAERAEADKRLRFKRGEMVVCTFAMQGWGNFVNTGVLCILMVIFGQTGTVYNKHRLGAVWRLSFGVGLIPVGFMLLYRIFGLGESKVFQGQVRRKTFDSQSSWLLFKHYWHRLVGTALAWFVWDVAFYGNKLFQGTFIRIIHPNASLLTALLYTLLNSGVALIGYYFAAFTVDKPWMGRTRLQNMGFLLSFICYIICAADYPGLTSTHSSSGIKWFQFLYYMSSFFGQFGPNATTWLLPGEVYPTEVRSTAHGISAATGKGGALLAAIWFNYVGNRKKFYITAFSNLIGLVLTILFVPNILRMDLREGDRRWQYISTGRDKEYHGEAVNPLNLSLWERLTGISKLYDPQLDYDGRRREAEAAAQAHAEAKFAQYDNNGRQVGTTK